MDPSHYSFLAPKVFRLNVYVDRSSLQVFRQNGLSRGRTEVGERDEGRQG